MSRLWRWMAPRSAGAAGVLSLAVTFNAGSAMFETERAGREGNTGPQLGALTIAVPGAAPLGNHYFYVRQTDALGRVVGYSVASLFASLAGYTGHAVDMPEGIHDSAAVADAFRAVAATVYTSATRVGSTVTLSDPNIRAASAFMPSTTNGGGGMLGTADITNGLSFTQEDSNVCTLVTPAFADVTYLAAVRVSVTSAYLEQLRLGIYTGGGINAPSGTPLLWDSGLFPAGVPINGYLTLYPTAPIVVPPSTRLQVLLVGAGAGTTTQIGYQPSGSAGDWTISPGGIWQVSGTAIGTNPAAALPAVFPAGGTNASSSVTMNIQLIYRTSPLQTDGLLRTAYGVHVPASALAFRSSFSSNVFVGGALPPQLEGLGIDYVETAAEGDASMRNSVYQRGVLEDPDQAVPIYDLGRGPAGPGLPTDWYRTNVPPAVHAAVDRGQLIWTAHRNNGTATIAFSNVAGPGPAGPDTNPMDWPDNTPGNLPEYETFTNPSFSIDPDVPFENPFNANNTIAPIDVRPGNVPGSKIGFRTRPVTLTPVP